MGLDGGGRAWRHELLAGGSGRSGPHRGPTRRGRRDGARNRAAAAVPRAKQARWVSARRPSGTATWWPHESGGPTRWPTNCSRAARAAAGPRRTGPGNAGPAGRPGRSGIAWFTTHVADVLPARAREDRARPGRPPANGSLEPGGGSGRAQPAAVTEPVPSPHRLVLSAAEFEFFVRRTGLGLPPPFDGSTVSSGQSTVDQALAALDPSLVDDSRDRRRGRAAHARGAQPGRAGASLGAGQPGRAGRAPVAGAGRGDPARGRSRAVFAVADQLGASLFARAGGAVELSLFAAVTLGRELIRAVPEESDVGRFRRPDPVLAR